MTPLFLEMKTRQGKYSCSYYDLPPYLKPCMLYLSMYPEDCLIKKSSLIWMWIAEGFVQVQNEGCCSLFEVGERYFDELLNRSMIQAVFDDTMSSIIEGCRVHDIVLDLIRDLSMVENFVTILGKKQLVESSTSVTRSMKELGLRKVRRLSIQSGVPLDTIGMAEVVRSIRAADCDAEASKLSSFRNCRVLSVMTFTGELKHMEKLRHLRYLEMDHNLVKLSEELGNFKSLQTIRTEISDGLPDSSTVFELAQLMCLDASIQRAAVIKIGNLVCLEELKLRIIGGIGLHDLGVALGKLTRLRVLEIWCAFSVEDACYRELMQCLNKLQEIREIRLLFRYRKPNRVETTREPLSPRLMDPSCLRRLRHLYLGVPGPKAVCTLGNLALLPELHSLSLEVLCEHRGFIVVPDGFQNLRRLRIVLTPTKPKFVQGAMPRLEYLEIQVRPGRDLEEINLASLLSLKEVMIMVMCRECFHGDDVEDAEAVVRRQVEDHPNRPTLHITRDWWFGRLSLPDDDMKLDKVVGVLVIVRDCRWDLDIGMQYYRWLEEITCDIDCEGSSLSDVEDLEDDLRRQAAFHPRRPKLVINRINQNKVLC